MTCKAWTPAFAGVTDRKVVIPAKAGIQILNIIPALAGIPLVFRHPIVRATRPLYHISR